MLNIVLYAAALLGVLVLVCFVYGIGSGLYVLFVHKSTLSRYLGPTERSWALVTGASDGIGRGCAEELLSRGFDVVLHGRNPTKLEGVKAELLKQWPARQVRIAILDVVASARDHAAVDQLASNLARDGIKVSVLVNNVGGAGCVAKAWVPLHMRTGKEIDNLIDVNATFTSQLTRAMLPLLFENTPALIISIGSVAGELPSPYLTPYAGSKAYIATWSRGLAAEMHCEKKDVEVLHINVGQVRAQHDRATPTLFAPSARRMGQAVMDVVGCERHAVTAYWPHALQMALITSIPTSLLNAVLIRISLEKKDQEEKGIKTE